MITANPLSAVSIDEQRDAADNYFDKQFMQLGFARNQISGKSSDELRQILRRINAALEQPDDFGKVRTKVQDDGTVVIATSRSPYHQKVGALPSLLERKKLVLEEIAKQSEGKELEAVKSAVDSVEDVRVRKRIVQHLNNLTSQREELRRETALIEEAQLSELQKADLFIRREKTDNLERRARVWKSFLERESMATFVGGFLLVVFSCSLIYAMFVDQKATEVVKNAFLLILGYFFGQSVSRSASSDK